MQPANLPGNLEAALALMGQALCQGQPAALAGGTKIDEAFILLARLLHPVLQSGYVVSAEILHGEGGYHFQCVARERRPPPSEGEFRPPAQP